MIASIQGSTSSAKTHITNTSINNSLIFLSFDISETFSLIRDNLLKFRLFCAVYVQHISTVTKQLPILVRKF